MDALHPAVDVLLIDGRSGSGKTQLADSVVRVWSDAGRDPQVLHVESLYPGWDGLAAGSLALAAVLRDGSYAPYGWGAGRFGERVVLPARVPLVIEGCGALTRANLAAAREWAVAASRTGSEPRVHGIWLDCTEATRKRRALARDGDVYAPHWDRWAAQETELYAAHTPWELADEVRPC